jgi:hypothetical protein
VARKPDFLIIGAQKCGTTWLWAVLRDHPEVFLPETKELEFFSYSKNLEGDGFKRYLATHFENAGSARAVGEATPSYFWNSEAHPEYCDKPKGFERDIPGAVLRHLGPRTRLVLALRSPVQRAISAYLHHVRKERIDRSRNIFDVGRDRGILHMGFYHEHLKEWLVRFPMRQIHLVILEEAAAQPGPAFTNLFGFLGVDTAFRSKKMNRAIHTGMERLWVGGELYLPRPGEAPLDPEHPDPARMDRVLTASDVRRLEALYADDVKGLEGLLGRGLDCWRS